MSHSFRIFIHLNDDNLHLKLAGDFDGTAAQELLGAIGSYGLCAKRIFIHTSGLESIQSDGRKALESGLYHVDRRRLVFTGPTR